MPSIFAPLPIDLSDGGVITTPRLASNQPTKINICDILTEKKYCVFSDSVAFFFVARILHVAQRMRQKNSNCCATAASRNTHNLGTTANNSQNGAYIRTCRALPKSSSTLSVVACAGLLLSILRVFYCYFILRAYGTAFGARVLTLSFKPFTKISIRL